MPVSRVEPFTRVYKRPNAKTDGHSQREWCSLLSVVADALEFGASENSRLHVGETHHKAPVSATSRFCCL